jgi:PAS domain S-box-containing protein
MLQDFANYFSTSNFAPHGYCFFWSPTLLWTYVVSDLTIAASYFSIPFALWYFVQKRPDVPFRWVFIMFGVFVLACGTTHLLALWNIWHVDYWADAVVKAFTASVSVATAILLWPLIPKALSVPSHIQLENANQKLQAEVMRRTQAESALLAAKNALERRVAARTAELERANDALRESEARYHALADLSSDWYWEQDDNLRFTRMSKPDTGQTDIELNTFLGHTRSDAPGIVWDESELAELDTIIAARQPFRDFEIGRIYRNGPKHYVRMSGEPMFDASGVFKGYRGVGMDITERKHAEEELRAAEEQFRGLVEQSIAGIYIIQDDEFAYVNPRFAEIRGFASAEELIGRANLSLVAEKDRGTVSENNRRLLAGETRNISYGFTALRKDGSTVEVGANAARATHNGRPAIIGLLQDISEKKRAEEEIRRYVEQLKNAFMSTVEIATTLSEMRDPYTAGHERRVSEIAVAIGAELGLDERQQEGLRVAGHLHDIGKITIPAEILSKPGKLSAIEFQLVQGHAEASYDVLKAVEFPWPVAQVALQHHERMDGSGYPHGLKGEAIMLEARIMAVADVIEAMSGHRPYRAALGIDKALAEIERGRGSAYDANIADACLRLFREKGYQLPA